MGSLVGLTFSGTVAANGELTLASRKLDFAYRVVEVRATFPPGLGRLVRVSFIVSNDPTVPSTGKPSGQSVLGQYSVNDYFVGDGEWKQLYCGVDVPQRGSWLKVYAVNSDSVPHAVDVQAVLEKMED